MSEKNLTKALEKKLLEKYERTGNEKVGFLVGNKVIEVNNIHVDPVRAFEVSLEDQELYVSESWAIWHTQPGLPSRLSEDDYTGFMNFPNHKHIIIGADGLRMYKVERNAVVKDYLALR